MGQEGDDGLQKYLQPRIKEITKYGVMTLAFDKDIVRPSNDTFFEEELRALIYTEDVHTGKVVRVPSLEIEIIQSEMHQELIELTWEYVGWANDREFELQLKYAGD